MILRNQIALRTPGLAAAVIGTPGEGNTSEADGEQFEPLVCIANIGPKQRRQRLVFGVSAFAVSLVTLALMAIFRLDMWWRLLLFVPFQLAASGYYQARDHT
jgi:hypothetical protein